MTHIKEEIVEEYRSMQISGYEEQAGEDVEGWLLQTLTTLEQSTIERAIDEMEGLKFISIDEEKRLNGDPLHVMMYKVNQTVDEAKQALLQPKKDN